MVLRCEYLRIESCADYRLVHVYTRRFSINFTRNQLTILIFICRSHVQTGLRPTRIFFNKLESYNPRRRCSWTRSKTVRFFFLSQKRIIFTRQSCTHKTRWRRFSLFSINFTARYDSYTACPLGRCTQISLKKYVSSPARFELFGRWYISILIYFSIKLPFSF